MYSFSGGGGAGANNITRGALAPQCIGEFPQSFDRGSSQETLACHRGGVPKARSPAGVAANHPKEGRPDVVLSSLHRMALYQAGKETLASFCDSVKKQNWPLVFDDAACITPHLSHHYRLVSLTSRSFPWDGLVLDSVIFCTYCFWDSAAPVLPLLWSAVGIFLSAPPPPKKKKRRSRGQRD